MAGAVVSEVESRHLRLATPCVGWDLHQLLGHIIGQNHGFADAVGAVDAPREAFADRRPAPDGVPEAWTESAEKLSAAFEAAPLDRQVVLAEFSFESRFPVSDVVGFHLLDTVVHGWDVATALDHPFHPDDDMVAETLKVARLIPDGRHRELPGSPFGIVIPTAVSEAEETGDDWALALALLGRHLTSTD